MKYLMIYTDPTTGEQGGDLHQLLSIRKLLSSMYDSS